MRKILMLVPSLLLTVPLGSFADSSAQVPLTPEQIRSREMLEYSTKYRPSRYSDDGPNPYGVGAHAFYGSYLHNPVPLAEELSFEKLVDVIKRKKLRTIESVLKELPHYMTDSNYVLMYRSRSLQEASPRAPRAIVYTPTASFILSFNGGDKDKAGAQTLETIQFRFAEKKFEFREIEFDGVNAPHVSAANPSKCLECHQAPSRRGVDMRPNWEPYSVWLGAFGSNDGDFSTTPVFQYRSERVRSQDREVLTEQAREFELFKTYINEIAPKHPRYKLLGRFNLHGPVDLTEHLAYWNFQRAIRLASADSEIYPLYREALAALIRCHYQAAEAFTPAPALQWHLQFPTPQYFSYDESSPLGSVSSILTTLFEPVGVDTSDWSMDFGTGGRFAFRERFGTPANPLNSLAYAWYQAAPDSAELEAKSCDDLQKTALDKLNAAYAEGRMERLREQRKAPAPKAQDLLDRCIRCHSGGGRNGAPALPFDDPAALARELNQTLPTGNGTLMEEIEYRTSEMATQREQMPRGRRLSAEERVVLMKYLKELQK